MPEDQFDLPQALGIDLLGVCESPRVTVVIGKLHMKDPGKQRTDPAAKMFLAPDGCRPETGPVEGVPEGDGLETARDQFCQLQGHLDRIRPARAEEDATEIPRCDLRQFFRQKNRRDVRVATRAEGERIVQLFPDRPDHIGMVEAGVVDAVAVHVDVPAAGEILDPGSFGLRNHVENGRGKTLMEEIMCVFVKPPSRLAGQVPLPVSLSGGRGVDIPLLRPRPAARFAVIPHHPHPS